MEFKVALVQKKAVPNQPDRNREQAVRCIEEAKKLGADMVLFPEMWSNGYAPPFEGAFDHPFDDRFEKERREWLEQAVSMEDAFIREIQAAARENRVGVTITFLQRTAGRPRNTAVILDRGGACILKYDKVHTCDFSLESLLENGKTFPVCEFDGVKLGVMICYDREFPESARILMLNGAEIILVPNACDMNPARLNQLSARAFENMTGIAMANYPGEDWGRSCAFSPVVFGENGYQDNELLMAGEREEGIFLAAFPMEEIRSYRNYETWGNAYRKVEAYGKLLDREIREPFVRGKQQER